MQGDFFIGVDIGTQGTRAAVYDLAGTLVAEAAEASILLHPAPGATEEDPERQYASVCRTIRSCIDRAALSPGSIAAVAIDGQMAGVIGTGADGIAVTPYDSWLDTRCASQVALMEKVLGDAILEKTGNVPSFNHGPKILWWKAERPAVWGRIAAFVQPGGYAAMRLCGLEGSDAFIDDTYLHFSGFADNAARSWDQSLASECAVPMGKLPRILAPGDRAGGVCASAAEASGLREGTPVAAGLGDTAASFLACGAVEAGVCVDVAGTASVFAATVRNFRPDMASRILGCGRSAVAGLWHPYAYINGGGLNLNWFAHVLATGAGTVLGSGAPGLGTELEERLDALGRQIEALLPSPEDPYFVPHMEGRVMPNDSGMRGIWAGLTRNHEASALYRSILEAVALEYAIYRDAVLVLNPGEGLTELRSTGGGARDSAWNSIKADLLGMPVIAVGRSGGAPMGAALVAAASVGAVPDLAKAAKSWVKAGRRFEPRKELAGIYGPRIARYRRLLDLASGFAATSQGGQPG